MNHKKSMAKALSLASEGKPRKNPYVGALVVKEGKIIGEGFHKGDGQPHAEIMAINSVKTDLKNAVLYTTLEPCCQMWEGKINKPCTDAIIQSGIKKVIIAGIDPNPMVNGKGLKTLKQHGIDVACGLLAEEEKYLNRKYRKKYLNRKPYVHLKMAQTLDGRIAKTHHKKTFVTGEDVREVVYTLRAQYQAVLVGSKTLLTDNPFLTVRNSAGENPIRIVLDSTLQFPFDCHLCDTKLAETIVYHNELVSQDKVDVVRSFGVQTQSLTSDVNGYLSLNELIEDLFSRGIDSLLVEGGATIAATFLHKRLVDEVSWFIRPGFGGDGVTSLYSPFYSFSMWDYPPLEKTEIERVGSDFCIRGLTFEGAQCLRDL